MDKIIPRCEWRTFGDSFGAADAAFAARNDFVHMFYVLSGDEKRH